MSWKRLGNCPAKFVRRILLVLLTIGFMANRASLGQCLVIGEVNIINPFTGDEKGLNFEGFKFFNGSNYAIFTVQGVVNTASGQKIRDYHILVNVDIDEQKDLNISIAEEISNQINSSAILVKERLQFFYIWTDEDLEKYQALNDFLQMALDFFKNQAASDGAFMITRAPKLYKLPLISAGFLVSAVLTSINAIIHIPTFTIMGLLAGFSIAPPYSVALLREPLRQPIL